MATHTVVLRVEVLLQTNSPEAEARLAEYGELAVASSVLIGPSSDLGGTDGYADLPAGVLTGYLGDISEEW